MKSDSAVNTQSFRHAQLPYPGQVASSACFSFPFRSYFFANAIYPQKFPSYARHRA